MEEEEKQFITCCAKCNAQGKTSPIIFDTKMMKVQCPVHGDKWRTVDNTEE